MRCTVKLAVAHAYDRLTTLGADFCQSRIFFNFNTPALIICEVPMEVIHVVECQQVNVFLYKIDTKKMTGDIQHHSAIMEVGSIRYYGLRELNL